MTLGEESPIFTKAYDLLLWLSGRASHFPKDQRFRLAQRIEDAAFGFHEQLIRATKVKSPKNKLRLLYEADVQLDKLRFYVRMAMDLKLINPRQYEHFARLVVEVGKLLGGWIKKVQSTST